MSVTYFYEGKGGSFSMSYQDLKERYDVFCRMSDDEFLAAIRDGSAIHFACFVSWFKELPLDATLGDLGVVHELAHILHLGCTLADLDRVREVFAERLVLA